MWCDGDDPLVTDAVAGAALTVLNFTVTFLEFAYLNASTAASPLLNVTKYVPVDAPSTSVTVPFFNVPSNSSRTLLSLLPLGISIKTNVLRSGFRFITIFASFSFKFVSSLTTKRSRRRSEKGILGKLEKFKTRRNWVQNIEKLILNRGLCVGVCESRGESGEKRRFRSFLLSSPPIELFRSLLRLFSLSQ